MTKAMLLAVAGSMAFALPASAASPAVNIMLADKAAAETCAAKLPADAKAVYDATAPGVKPDTDLRDEIRSRTIGLVMAGTLDRDTARPAAEAAGACLKDLKG